MDNTKKFDQMFNSEYFQEDPQFNIPPQNIQLNAPQFNVPPAEVNTPYPEFNVPLAELNTSPPQFNVPPPGFKLYRYCETVRRRTKHINKN